jgi:hypothetical protein
MTNPSNAGAYCRTYLTHRRRMRDWSAKAQFVAAKYAMHLLGSGLAATHTGVPETLAQLDAATDALMERGACAEVLGWFKRAEA